VKTWLVLVVPAGLVLAVAGVLLVMNLSTSSVGALAIQEHGSSAEQFTPRGRRVPLATLALQLNPHLERVIGMMASSFPEAGYSLRKARVLLLHTYRDGRSLYVLTIPSPYYGRLLCFANYWPSRPRTSILPGSAVGCPSPTNQWPSNRRPLVRDRSTFGCRGVCSTHAGVPILTLQGALGYVPDEVVRVVAVDAAGRRVVSQRIANGTYWISGTTLSQAAARGNAAVGLVFYDAAGHVVFHQKAPAASNQGNLGV
jgi:hypothetical protein